MFSKSGIRNDMKEQRLAMTPEMVMKMSQTIVSKIMELEEYQECKTILLYAPIMNEVDVMPLLRDAISKNKQVGCPVCLKESRMEFFEVFDESDLKPGRFGILEPAQDILIEESEALMILPAVAYDRRKNRIGQGGGYYDRYLERYPDIYRLGVAYDFQIVDSFETDQYDRPVDLIITDTHIVI